MSIIKERKKLNKAVRKAKSIFLMAHKDLDLDALGSSIGMLKLLEKRRKQVYLIIDDRTHEAGVEKVLRELEGCLNIVRSDNLEEYLNPKENKKNLIRDDIYLNNLTLSNLVKISVPLAIFLFVVVVAGIIASFFIEPKAIKLLIYIVGASLLAASFVLVILHFAWKNSLKKKYYNGTNPFIFK